MGPPRDDDERPLSTAARVAGPGAVLLHGTFSHDDGDELAIVIEGSAVIGAMTAPEGEDRLTEEVFELNRHIAVWIPAGITHSVRLRASSLICPMRFDFPRPDDAATPWRSVTEVRMTPELRSLALAEVQSHLVPEQAPGKVKRAVLELLPTLDSTGLALRMPTHPQAAHIARKLRAEPAAEPSLQEWADSLFVSTKTIQRAFVADTGLTFTQWRTRCRMRMALSMLCHGYSPEAVTPRVGYDSLSGFTTAFRREVGMEPRDAAL